MNAKVLSLNAKMYEISLTDIEDFCHKISVGNTEKEQRMTMIDFFGLVEESITMKKILFRQNQLSEQVNQQNKSKYQQLF